LRLFLSGKKRRRLGRRASLSGLKRFGWGDKRANKRK